MTERQGLATIELQVDRQFGWLNRLLGAVEARAYALDAFVLRGRQSGSSVLTIALTVRTNETNGDIAELAAALEALPGVRRSVSPPAQRQHAFKDAHARVNTRALRGRNLRDGRFVSARQ